MPTFNNNDREESKPIWLTAAQKRYCVRTNRGWELPSSGGFSNLVGQPEGTKSLTGISNFVPTTELLVAMPNNTSATGATPSNFAGRTVSSNAGGTASSEIGLTVYGSTGYAPYISCPFTGDSQSVGGPGGNYGAGLSHSASVNFGINEWGVSTLRWGAANQGMSGGTGYIKIVGNDSNFTDGLTMSCLTGGVIGIQFYTDANLVDTTKVPVAFYETAFGPTAAHNKNIGVVVLAKSLTSGTYGLTASVYDGSQTGSSRFTITVL